MKVRECNCGSAWFALQSTPSPLGGRVLGAVAVSEDDNEIVAYSGVVVCMSCNQPLVPQPKSISSRMIIEESP